MDNKVPEWFGRTEIAPNLPHDIEEIINDVAERSGFIPNVFSALSHMPAEFRAFFGYHDALMGKTGFLSRAEKEMIVVATSSANSCTYCVVAHGAILRIRSKSSSISELVTVDYKLAGLPDRQIAILDFAMKVALEAHRIVESDFEPLYSAGLDDRDIWEVGAIAAFFAMSNRIAGFARILPNSEFHAMGRDF